MFYSRIMQRARPAGCRSSVSVASIGRSGPGATRTARCRGILQIMYSLRIPPQALPEFSALQEPRPAFRNRECSVAQRWHSLTPVWPPFLTSGRLCRPGSRRACDGRKLCFPDAPAGHLQRRNAGAVLRVGGNRKSSSCGKRKCNCFGLLFGEAPGPPTSMASRPSRSSLVTTRTSPVSILSSRRAKPSRCTDAVAAISIHAFMGAKWRQMLAFDRP